MSAKKTRDRRNFLRGGTLLGTLLLGGCDKFADSETGQKILGSASNVNRWVQRLVTSRKALAPEYTEADLSPMFRANGSDDPDTPEYNALVDSKFADFRLKIDGLVERPMAFSLAELRALPSRTQITRHDCVEGWSCIGKWTGVRLSALLERAGLKADARYLVFHCADELEKTGDGSGLYYESIDLDDAFHEQTILAYEMNDATLEIAHGAPLRLRVERQLGYKQAKYVMRIEAVDSFASLHGGKGGFWEDRGYEWYAGI